MGTGKYFIEGITLYKYCKLHNINYKSLSAKASYYGITPVEAMNFTKERGYTKLLKKYGITRDNPDFNMYYNRLRDGWDIEDVINTPKLPKGGNWRNKRNAKRRENS